MKRKKGDDEKKNRLKKEQIFIANENLTWEERKIQVRINK